MFLAKLRVLLAQFMANITAPPVRVYSRYIVVNYCGSFAFALRGGCAQFKELVASVRLSLEMWQRWRWPHFWAKLE